MRRVKQQFPELEVILNGGIRTLAQARAELAHLDGVMPGREACQNPFALAAWERTLYQSAGPGPTAEIVRRLLPYVER